MSPWYLESRWCKEEREAWAAGIGGDAGRIAKEFNRAFVIRVQDTGENPWPPEFSDAKGQEYLGFWLYDRSEGQFAPTFGWIGDSEDQGKYKRALLSLRQTILKTLDQLHARLKEGRDRRGVRAVAGMVSRHRDNVPSRQSVLGAPTSQGKVDVFISYAREDKHRARQLAETLAKEGYAVF